MSIDELETHYIELKVVYSNIPVLVFKCDSVIHFGPSSLLEHKPSIPVPRSSILGRLPGVAHLLHARLEITSRSLPLALWVPFRGLPSDAKTIHGQTIPEIRTFT